MWLILGDGVNSFPTLLLNQSGLYVAVSAVATAVRCSAAVPWK
ncbi:MAG: hypothetical protein WCS94_03955 [Verrucomicrobiota bacterium]